MNRLSITIIHSDTDSVVWVGVLCRYSDYVASVLRAKKKEGVPAGTPR